MSRVNGQLVTCDRCDAEVFIKCTGEGEADGGYTRWNKFEPLPTGWGSHKGKMLCPDCYQEWGRLETEFMNKTNAFFKRGEART